MKVEITKLHSQAVDEALVERAARRAVELAGGRLDELSVVLVDDGRIVQLNRRLLGRDGPTDVIAFEAEADPDAVRAEVYVNVDAALRQARELGHSFEWELAFLVAHAALHALGMDDASESERARMFQLQRAAADWAVSGQVGCSAEQAESSEQRD